ncbi:DUF4446 family protein [uncultured Jatrophihabitans sp.]|uniref:DUF4446 family protein n=1 Tax=uncultured Jatrophihabitans sp. TaxID=1610747 RepID=UPI0035C9714B
MSTYVAVFALVLAYVALVGAYFALRTLAKLRRASAILARGGRGPEGQASLLEATHRNTERTEVLAEQLAELRAQVASGPAAGAPAASGAAQGALRNVALVRYDALGSMSGHLSFSLALLDEQGDGVTLSAIAGNADTRVYAKGVSAGKGAQDLSPEEAQAVAAALDKRRGLLGRRSA